MPPKQKYTDPKLRDEVKEEIQQSDKGGEPGQWSARKAQMMAKEYKKRGGDYNTDKSQKDESQKNLSKWGDEDWQTKEGSGDAKKDDGSRKRYLPKKAWDKMSEKEKKETDDKKQKGSKEGKQFVGNTKKAKNARKEANKDAEDDADDNEKADKDTGDEAESTEESENEAENNEKVAKDTEDDSEDSEKSDEAGSGKENDSPSPKRKRNAKQQKDEDNSASNKKQKSNNGNAKSAGNKSGTVGSKHDSAEAPATQASVDRLPKKGQKAHWKALPGWVDGEVVEIVKSQKKVDGKNVKGSKDDPKIVLKSSKSGKICVHNVDNVFFD